MYTETDYENKLHKLMTALGLPELDEDFNPPRKIPFVVRVDMLVNHCKDLKDNLKKLEAEHTEYFASRGTGSDKVPCCFVCGVEPNDYYSSNISGFVQSKEAGERIVAMFDGRARLDFRDFEPNWIQVKFGVCKLHQSNLEGIAVALRKNIGISRGLIEGFK